MYRTIYVAGNVYIMVQEKKRMNIQILGINEVCTVIGILCFGQCDAKYCYRV